MWPLKCTLDIGESALWCMFTAGDSRTTGGIIREEIKREYCCREAISQGGLEYGRREGGGKMNQRASWKGPPGRRGERTTMAVRWR